jgi:two-component system sensor histidine kinase BaeS
LGIGVVLTRRAVEEANLKGLGRQADVLAKREREATLPCFRLRNLRSVLARQGERATCVPLSKPTPLLSADDRRKLRKGGSVQGSLRLDGEKTLFAARPVNPKALVLLRPARLRGSDWLPFLEGLLAAALVGATLAAVVSVLLARAIVRPVRRVADATRSLAAGASPAPVPVESRDELGSLATSFNEMAAQLTKAREAEKSFLLSVSHELKTPLTAIRGYAEALREGAVDPEEAGDTLAREAGRLERLVHDLLDLARMNRSEFAVHREPIDLAGVAEEAARRYAPQADEYGVALELDAPVPAPALADGDRVLQVLSNLVENSLRSTPAGGTVRVSAGPAELRVSDTGPGLAPDELPRAFERFFLYSRYAESDRRVGSGLGLAIVKELSEAMAGSVAVESTPGEGSTFTVRLPRADPAALTRKEERLDAPAPTA